MSALRFLSSIHVSHTLTVQSCYSKDIVSLLLFFLLVFSKHSLSLPILPSDPHLAFATTKLPLTGYFLSFLV